MTNELVPVTHNADIITFDDEKRGLIKRLIAQDATDDELALFLHQCQRTGLDPLAKQIYFQKYKTKNGWQMAIITGIDGYRLVADRTGKYAGNDEPVFDGQISITHYNETVKAPAKATVTVWKLVGGQRMPFSASTYWQEYYPGDQKGFQWRKMPHVMLAKCAEAAALRKAFPADLSGVYTRDEMEQADFIEGEIIHDTGNGQQLDEALARENAHALGADFDDEEEPADPVDAINTELLGHKDGHGGNGTGDSRGATSPRAQAQRQRPVMNAPEDSEVDHMAEALAANDLKTFAEHAYYVIDGYDSNFNIVGALTQKWPEAHDQKSFRFTSSKIPEYMEWLADRKREAAND